MRTQDNDCAIGTPFPWMTPFQGSVEVDESSTQGVALGYYMAPRWGWDFISAIAPNHQTTETARPFHFSSNRYRCVRVLRKIESPTWIGLALPPASSSLIESTFAFLSAAYTYVLPCCDEQ